MPTLSDLNDMSRMLSGVEDRDLMPDYFVYQLLNQAYQDLCGMEKWSFMEQTDYKTLVAGSHLVTTSTGVLTVQEVIIRDTNNTMQMKPQLVESTLAFKLPPISFSTACKSYYDVQNSSLEIFPAFTEDTVVEVRYQGLAPVLEPEDSPVFRQDFHVILAYRVAYQILVMQADETNRLRAYPEEQNAIYQRMFDTYMLAHDTSGFQISGRRSF